MDTIILGLTSVWRCVWGPCLTEKWPSSEEVPSLPYCGVGSHPELQHTGLCQGTTVWITDLHLITSQFQDHLWDHLWDRLQGHLHGCLVDHLWLISDSISNPISGQLCDHCHDYRRDCLYDCLIDHLHLITGKLHDQLCDQLCILNSDIVKAQDPGLGLREAMAKDRRIVHSLIIQCCTTCMYILMLSLMMGP